MTTQSEAEVQQYLDQHKIGPAVEEAINAAVKAKAADPHAFIAKHLEAKSASAADANKPSGGALSTNPRGFKLERFFALHEFSAKHLLSSSDVESLSVKDLLTIAADDAESMAAWENLSLAYTESKGHPELLREIAATYESGVIKPDDVLEIAPEEGILISMQHLVERGDSVIVTWPAYQSLYEIAEARGGEVHRWRTRGGGDDGPLRFDVDDLEAAIASIGAAGGKVKLIVANFPHNPTGSTLAPDQWERLIGAARAAGAWLFSDEMYRGLEHGDAPPLPSACECYEKAVCLSGMSKVYAMPGLRIGWLVCRDAGFMAAVGSLKDYTTICGSAPSQVLALIGLRHRAKLLARSKEITAEGFAALVDFFGRHADKFDFEPPAVGPIAFVGVKGEGLTSADAQAYSERLVAASGIFILPASTFEAGDEAALGCRFRFGFGKKGYAEMLAAWEATLETTPLPGK